MYYKKKEKGRKLGSVKNEIPVPIPTVLDNNFA